MKMKHVMIQEIIAYGVEGCQKNNVKRNVLILMNVCFTILLQKIGVHCTNPAFGVEPLELMRRHLKSSNH